MDTERGSDLDSSNIECEVLEDKSFDNNIRCGIPDGMSPQRDLELPSNKLCDAGNVEHPTLMVNDDSRLEGKFVADNIVNLSNKILSEDEISVLSKGLKFCPTPKEIDRAELKRDLEKFGRRMRLKWHYRNEDDDFSYSPFRPKSTFHPKNESVAIECYLSCIEEQIMSIVPEGNNYSNLSEGEKKALKTLFQDKSIVIKEADKGSAVVVWDREDYCKEADIQLSNGDIYEEITADPVPALKARIEKCFDKINDRGDLEDTIMQYFVVENPKLGRFYLLPKIHKRMQNVPGRPVISNSGYFTENISAFFDYHLQPLAKGIKSYIKDTNEFLKKIQNLPDLPEDTIVCTIDVVGLYPNIPHVYVTAIKEALDAREDKTVSTETIMELAELVLQNNFFTHNNNVYKQKHGTAIGTKFAPPYAVLSLGKFESEALDGYPLKPWVWWRYIDDIFLIWQYGEEALDAFILFLNSINPTLKFTKNISRTQIEFLDVMVIRDGNKILTDLYVKRNGYTSVFALHLMPHLSYQKWHPLRSSVASQKNCL